MPTGLHCLLLGGLNYRPGPIIKYGRPGMDGSVSEAQSHDEGRRGRSVTGVHGSVTGAQNKGITGAWKNKWAQKCNGGMASRFSIMHGVFLSMGCNNKLKDQSIFELVIANHFVVCVCCYKYSVQNLMSVGIDR